MSEPAILRGYRQAAQLGNVPDVSFKKMFRLALRTWPFMRPMLKHLVLLGSVTIAGSAIALVAFIINADIFQNKVLVGEKLQPMQATILFLDRSYVDPFVIDSFGRDLGEQLGISKLLDNITEGDSQSDEGEELVKKEERITEVEKAKLSKEQRKVVRNRLVIFSVISGILGGITWLLIPYYNMWIWQSINQNLRVAMIERAESLSLKYHDNARVGDAIFRVYQDSAQIINLLQAGIMTPIATLYGVIMGLAIVAAFDPLFALTIIIAGTPMVFLTIWFTPRIRRQSLNNRKANSDLTSRLQEVFSSIKIVKANRAEDRVLDRFNKDSYRALDAAYFLRMDMALLTVLVAVIGGATLIFCEYVMVSWILIERETFFGAWAVALIGFMVWNLGAYNIAVGRVNGLAQSGRELVAIWNRMQDMFIGLERAFFLLDLEPEVIDPAKPKDFPQPIKTVSWKDVKFGYESQQNILDGINLQAAAGTVTAIVGGTGAGKSTVMSMLLRLYDPDEGQLLVNNLDLRQMTIDDVRGNIAIALQKNVLFADTVANNISYSMPGASRQQIVDAAKIACADEFILSMSEGYDTELGERGGKLSAGQRQRLSIARAVVRNTPILILDEPTASLDAKTEHNVLNNLSEWGRGRIIFLVTHRLSTIRNADHIAFLENGKFVEHGSHTELMNKENGRYRTFVVSEQDGSDLDSE